MLWVARGELKFEATERNSHTTDHFWQMSPTRNHMITDGPLKWAQNYSKACHLLASRNSHLGGMEWMPGPVSARGFIQPCLLFEQSSGKDAMVFEDVCGHGDLGKRHRHCHNLNQACLADWGIYHPGSQAPRLCSPHLLLSFNKNPSHLFLS